MFANCSKGYMNMAMPDVCITPVPSPTGPIPTPLPYPNKADGMNALPNTTALKVMFCNMPAHTTATSIPMSTGDAQGAQGGVLSGMFMGACKHMKGSTSVFAGGMPVTRLSDPTGQNGQSLNVPGMTIKPAQNKVIIVK